MSNWDDLRQAEFVEFIAAHWDARPALLEGPRDRFLEIYSVEEFEQRLTQSDIRYPQFQLVQHGRSLSQNDYTRRRMLGSRTIEDLVDIAAVYKLWNEGATIVLQSLHTCAPRLGTFLVRLEQALGHPTQANAYLTPAASQGFETHYDTHDVVVLQIDGSKHWRVWADPAPTKPLRNDFSPKHSAPAGPLMFDAVLNQGSALYIPRGFYHDARACDETSLHVTVGIQVYRRLDALNFLFEKVLNELAESGSTEWRNSMNLMPSGQRDRVFDALRDSVLALLKQRWSPEATHDRFKEDRRPVNQFLLESSGSFSGIDQNSRLILDPRIIPHVVRGDQTVQVTYLGKVLTLPQKAGPALDMMLTGNAFTPSELQGYGHESRLLLCRHLLREGLLQVERNVIW